MQAYIIEYIFAIYICKNKKSKYLYFTFTYSFSNALSSCRSKFLTYIIFLLSKELLLTFLARQTYWQKFLSFVCQKKILYFSFTFRGKFQRVHIFRLDLFSQYFKYITPFFLAYIIFEKLLVILIFVPPQVKCFSIPIPGFFFIL